MTLFSKFKKILKNERGFTLLEIMIVLVLMTLVTGLFIDPISRIYDLRHRLRNQIDGIHLSVLAQNWFRASISGIYMTKSKFSGEPKKITGVSYYPLNEDIGVPSSFEWSLDYDNGNDVTLLNYKGFGEEVLTIAEWKGNEGVFSYYNPDSKAWESEWQSSSLVQEDDYKLPRYIRLDGKLDDKDWIILANLEPSRPYQKSVTDRMQKMIAEMKERVRIQKEEKEMLKEKKEKNTKEDSKTPKRPNINKEDDDDDDDN